MMMGSRRKRDGEHGQVLVLFTFAIILLMGLAAIVIDAGLLRTDGAQLKNALDAAALAGVYDMPATTANNVAVITTAKNTARASFSRIGTPDVPDPIVTFACIIGYDPDTKQPRVGDMTAGVCHVSFSVIDSHWKCVSDICWAPCTPDKIGADVCNTILVTASATRPYSFGSAVGINSGSTGALMSAACRGPCGTPLPLDAVLILDRTLSMQQSGSIQNLKTAADAVLQAWDPAFQRVALGLIGPSSTAATCGTPAVNVVPWDAVTYVSDASASTPAAGATALTITAPATPDTSDLLVAGITVSGGSLTTITPPSGWTLVTRKDSGNILTSVGLATYYKIATASEPVSYQWMLGSGSKKASGGIIRLSGADPTNPIDAAGSGNSGTSGTTLTAPGVTSTLGNGQVVGFFASSAAATFTQQNGNGMTEQLDQRPTTGGPAIQGVTLASSPSTPGATGSKTATASTGGAWAAQLIAVKPEAYATDPAVALSKWIPIGFTGTDNNTPAPANPEAYVDPTTDPPTLQTSDIVSAIDCFSNSSAVPATTLSTPVEMATYYLLHNGRANTKKGIILETDGTPQQGSVGDPADFTCQAAYDAAQSAKAAGIEIFTIGYGVSGKTCYDTSGTYHGQPTTKLLADMATGPNTGTPCDATENTDNDHMFCQATGESLSDAFKSAAVMLAASSRLVQLYPIPIVTGVSPSTGSKSSVVSVTISGQFLAGATSVKFGGADATSFSVNSATSITATAPTVTVAQTVDIIVTTPGGRSPIVAADQFTYTTP